MAMNAAKWLDAVHAHLRDEDTAARGRWHGYPRCESCRRCTGRPCRNCIDDHMATWMPR